jgi:hypothetical protein
MLSVIPAQATPADLGTSPDFLEIKRLAGLIHELWKSKLSDDEKRAEVDQL